MFDGVRAEPTIGLFNVPVNSPNIDVPCADTRPESVIVRYDCGTTGGAGDWVGTTGARVVDVVLGTVLVVVDVLVLVVVVGFTVVDVVEVVVVVVGLTVVDVVVGATVVDVVDVLVEVELEVVDVDVVVVAEVPSYVTVSGAVSTVANDANGVVTKFGPNSN